MADENLNVLGMQTVTEDAFNSLDVEHKDSYNSDNSDNSDNSTNVAVADSGNSDSSTNVARFWTCQLSPSPPRRRG